MAESSASSWTIAGLYHKAMGDPDPRTVDWPFVNSPIPTLSLIGSYVLFAKVIGPAIMKNRKPFDLRLPMIIYNFFMVVATSYLVYVGGKVTYFDGYKIIGCQPVDRSTSPKAMRIAIIGWWAYMFRFVEFIDTAFFILRKKFSHITTLHLFHHSALPLFGYLAITYHPGGHAAMPTFINANVHIVMYTYYGLAAIGPHMQKYLTWKRHLTILQMVQFLFIFLHTSQMLISPCGMTQTQVFLILFFSGLFFFLFLNFYIHEYKMRMRKKDDDHLKNGHKSANGKSSNGNTTNGKSTNGHNGYSPKSLHYRNGTT